MPGTLVLADRIGDVVALPEISVCQWPRIRDARWLGV